MLFQTVRSRRTSFSNVSSQRHISFCRKRRMSMMSIYWRIGRLGCNSYRPFLSPPLNRLHWPCRLWWCNGWVNWVQEWYQVVLSDEYYICLWDHDGCRRITSKFYFIIYSENFFEIAKKIGNVEFFIKTSIYCIILYLHVNLLKYTHHFSFLLVTNVQRYAVNLISLKLMQPDSSLWICKGISLPTRSDKRCKMIMQFGWWDERGKFAT